MKSKSKSSWVNKLVKLIVNIFVCDWTNIWIKLIYTCTAHTLLFQVHFFNLKWSRCKVLAFNDHLFVLMSTFNFSSTKMKYKKNTTYPRRDKNRRRHLEKLKKKKKHELEYILMYILFIKIYHTYNNIQNTSIDVSD